MRENTTMVSTVGDLKKSLESMNDEDDVWFLSNAQAEDIDEQGRPFIEMSIQPQFLVVATEPGMVVLMAFGLEQQAGLVS